MMDVFEAFKNSILDTWALGKASKSTLTGPVVSDWVKLDVIIDFEETTARYGGETVQPIESDALIYVKSDALPTKNTSELIASYKWKNLETGEIYDITKIGVAKNQHTGNIEHYEFFVQQGEALDE